MTPQNVMPGSLRFTMADISGARSGFAFFCLLSLFWVLPLSGDNNIDKVLEIWYFCMFKKVGWQLGVRIKWIPRCLSTQRRRSHEGIPAAVSSPSGDDVRRQRLRVGDGLHRLRTAVRVQGRVVRGLGRMHRRMRGWGWGRSQAFFGHVVPDTARQATFPSTIKRGRQRWEQTSLFWRRAGVNKRNWFRPIIISILIEVIEE